MREGRRRQKTKTQQAIYYIYMYIYPLAYFSYNTREYRVYIVYDIGMILLYSRRRHLPSLYTHVCKDLQISSTPNELKHACLFIYTSGCRHIAVVHYIYMHHRIALRPNCCVRPPETRGIWWEVVRSSQPLVVLYSCIDCVGSVGYRGVPMSMYAVPPRCRFCSYNSSW